MFAILFFCLTFYIIFGIINLFVYIIFKFLKYTFKITFGIINLCVYVLFKVLKYTFKITFGIIKFIKYIFECIFKCIFKFLKYTFKIIFGIINLFVYIIFKFFKYTFKIIFGIFKFLKYIFKFIIGTNKHKEKYDKKILSQAVNKVFLNNVRKKTARNIFSDTDLNATLSRQLYNHVENERIITDKIKNYFKDKISFLFSIFYVRDSTEYNYNNFKRITDNVIYNLNNRNDEILKEYRKLKNNY